MRFVWLVFVGLIAAMLVVLPRLKHRAVAPTATALRATASPAARPAAGTASFAALRNAPTPPGLAARADSVVAFGLAQRGTPYVYAGTSPLTGFDCSGFIMFTFAHFNVAVPHSTALLIDVGRPVARADAQPGDIVVFTGTDKASTTPGHAGIVVSGRGEVPLRFVHASSSRREPFVKVSQVENSDYERRFMQVRRVLGPGEPAVARPKPAAAPVAALPTRPVAVAPAAIPAAALPKTLATRKYPTHRAAKKKAAVKKSRKKKRPVPALKRPVVKPAPIKHKAPVKPKRSTGNR